MNPSAANIGCARQSRRGRHTPSGWRATDQHRRERGGEQREQARVGRRRGQLVHRRGEAHGAVGGDVDLARQPLVDLAQPGREELVAALRASSSQAAKCQLRRAHEKHLASRFD